jgi:uncharacterized protein (DUF1778 family)
MTTTRIEMRVPEDLKALVERAASVAGQSLTTFAVSTLVERAHQVLAQHETTVLSARDREVFLHALDEKPNPALHKAAARFKARHAHP